jgi:hypothetical protein
MPGSKPPGARHQRFYLLFAMSAGILRTDRSQMIFYENAYLI